MSISNRHICRLAIIFFLAFLLGSCSAKRVLVHKERTVEDLKSISDLKLLNSTEDSYVEFKTLFFKKFEAEAHLNGESKSFKGNLFIQKDSVIVLSVLGLGIELFRVKFVEDSVCLINKAKREVLSGGYDYLWDKFYVDLNFQVVQDILLNQLFCYPISEKDDGCIKKYKNYNGDNAYVLKSIKDGKFSRRGKRKGFDDVVFHEFHIEPDIFRVSRCYLKDFNFDTEMDITYTDFVELSDKVFPSVIEIKGIKGQNNFSMLIKFTDIEVNGLNKLSFKYSDNYKVGSF